MMKAVEETPPMVKEEIKEKPIMKVEEKKESSSSESESSSSEKEAPKKEVMKEDKKPIIEEPMKKEMKKSESSSEDSSAEDSGDNLKKDKKDMKEDMEKKEMVDDKKMDKKMDKKKKEKTNGDDKKKKKKSKTKKEDKMTKEEDKTMMKEEKKETMKDDMMKGSIIKEGFLEKKGVIRHNWLKRWFVLEKGEKWPIIRYYKDQKDVKSGKAKGEFFLVNATLYAHVEKKGTEMPNYFNIRVGARDFLIRALDANEKVDWVKSIKANIVKDPEAPNSPKNLKVKKSNSFLGVVKENK